MAEPYELLSAPLDERLYCALVEEGFDEGDAENGARAVLDVLGVWVEVHAERLRAHAKHGATSMESADPLDPAGVRRDIITEEWGEVAKEYNEARHHHREVDCAKLRAELIQMSAMTGAWADALAPAPVAFIPCRNCGEPISESRTYAWLHVGGWKVCGKRGRGGVARPRDESQPEATYGDVTGTAQSDHYRDDAEGDA